MIKNYLKIAFRNLRRHPFYAFVNIFGLALGIACCILIALFIRDEWSFDKFHEDADRIYRVALFEHYEDHDYLNVETPFVFGPFLAQNAPEVEEAVRIVGIRDQIKRGEDVQSGRIYLADPNFFEMFDFPLIKGESAGVLEGRQNLLLSEDAAVRWFGEEDPLGKTLTLQIGEEGEDFVVAGIVKNTPANSSIRFDYLISMAHASSRWDEREMQNLFNVFVETYLRLPENYDIAQLEAKIPGFVQQAMGEDYVEGAYVLRFQPLTDIHLNTDYPAGMQPTSDPWYSYILGIIAAFVLLIACINFMTLTLSRSADRAKEVGVRKTLGANRGQLVGQFWGETVLFCVFGLMFGVALAFSALPAFNTLAEKSLTFTFDGSTTLIVLGIVLAVGLLAGSYPALFLSGYRPVEVLKGRLQIQGGNALRRALTVVQFTLAILLVISTLIMGDQLTYLQEKNLGYDREQMVSMPTGLGRPEGMQLLERFRNEVAGYPSVEGVTASLFTFGEPWLSAGYRTTDGAFRQFRMNLVDPDYLSTMKIPVIAGRDFSREISADQTEAVIVNRAFAALHGWEDPIDKSLPGARFNTHRIIGMVEDFNYSSLHATVEPLALTLSPVPLYDGLGDMDYFAAPQPKVLVRIKASETAAGLRIIEDSWNKVASGVPFNYAFVDDVVDQQYGQEQRLSTIIEYATILVILIASLGLFGLASLMVVKRTKEIGVRKVMGASAGNIVTLLTRDLVTLVVIAFILATPVAYVVMSIWLQDFAYATALRPITFLLAGVVTLGIALLTVSYHSTRAALSNPIDALRYE